MAAGFAAAWIKSGSVNLPANSFILDRELDIEAMSGIVRAQNRALVAVKAEQVAVAVALSS